MHLFWDLDSDSLVTAPKGSRLASVTVKARSKVPIVLTCVRGGIAVTPPTASLRFGIKVAVGTTLLAISGVLTLNSGVLVGVVNTNTTAMNAAMGRMWSRQMIGEITGIVEDNDPIALQTVKVIVEGKVVTDGDEAPVDLPTAEDWLDARTVRKDKVLVLDFADQARFLSNLGITINSDGVLFITTVDGTFDIPLNLT